MRKSRPQRASPKTSPMSPSRTQSPMSAVSSSSRSPSPLSRQGAPVRYLTTGQRLREDAAEESDTGIPFESPVGQGGNCISPGIRYITEPLINKLSKQENVARVTALNLSLAKDGGKKFKYIENLEKCEKLEVLNLSHNLIEKVEKLDKLLKLCDLNLSYNKISKIEGIEHLHNLQKLNLAGNEIEHVPVWMGKKLRSLRILNLRKNKISSLHEVAKLKPLKNLTSLFLSDNPVANLPHYRPFTIFHLRSLEDLEGQPVTDCDREEATERFNLEEIENLEKDLEKAMKELEDLNNKQSDLLEKLQQQEDLNKSLKQNHLRQKQSCKDLESELETKNELLKQKTVELTRACQKQYELEQELAFYKIDAKFEPLGYYPAEDVDLDDVPGESPYIGKARYKRNMYAVEGYIPSKAQKLQVGSLGQEEQQNNQQLKLNLLQSLDLQLQEKEKQMKGAQEKLSELHSEAVNAEQRVLKATEELRQLQDAVAQKKMLEVEKDCLRQKLSNKILLLSQLKGEALELEKQMEQQKQEMAKKEEEVEGLQIFTDSLDPKDPKHAHMKAQKASKEQQLDMMSKHYKELETCLDDMLSRIARETEEIRDLEQQLTDGQIAVNDALKKDLEAIIIGLQEYLETVKGQAKQTSDECKELRKDKEALLQKLEELEDEKNQLEIVAMDAENMRKEIADLELALHEQREVNQELQEAQGELGAYEAELEAELKARDSEISQHTEELERIKQLSQLEHSALQAELDKERQALENALTKAHLSEEKEQENSKLLSQLKQLQRENNSLKQQLQETKNQLNRAVDHLIHPEEVLARVSELKKALRTGAEIRCHNPKDILGKSLADLQKQFGEILARSQQETEAAQARERGLQEEMASRQARLEEAHEKHKLACSKAAEAKIKSEKKQNEARVRQLEDEIQHLSEQLKSMEEIQGLTDQQLQEAEEEKGRMIAQLEDLENRKKVEDARVQMQFLSLNEELKELKEAVSASERQATAELCAATDQLRALHGTVGKINQWRSQELEDAEKMSMQASQAADALARAEAEIELLQRLLKEKEEQHEMEKVDAETAATHFQKEETDKLNQLLKCQKAEADRLRAALDEAGAGKSKEIGSILDEIAALRHAVSHQNDAIARLLDPLKWKGHSYYIPSSSQASTPASQSTKDSGVGLQCPMPTSVNKVHAEGERGKKKHSISPAGRGCRLHSTGRDGLQESPHSGEKREDGGGSAPHDGSYLPPPGSVIYTLLPDGAPAPQGTVVYGPPPPPGPACGGQLAPTTVIYGSPPPGAQLVHSPLPAHCSVPLVPVGVLHCNIPEHHNLENKILSLEGSIDKLMSQRPEGACPAASHHRQHKQTEELRQGIQDLLSEREELEHQVTELRRVAQKRNRRKDFIDGCMSGIISELELEKSLQHHGSIVDEIECIEKTLLKRRAELREADRLLAEAENELETTQGKTKDVIQKYNSSKQHLSWTEKEAEELERRAQEMAVRLVKADQQLRLLRAGAKDLEQHKMQQEGILKEINKVVSAKDYEFQSLSQKIEILTESLQKLQADIQVAEGNEDHHLQILKEAENILQSKKSELERLKDQTATQQEELRHLDQLLDQKKEELRLLQESIVRRSADLTEVLKEGEAEVAEKWQQIKEVKSFLADLSVQKGELSAQLSEKRSQLSLITQGIRKENENLQDTLGLIMKHKTELKHILETLQLESSELEGLKLQHNQKLNELQKMHTEILEGKLELENLQRASQQERGEMELQRQLLERMQQDVKQLNSHLCTLQKSIQALNKQKQQLEENCESLEQKLSQTERALASAEESNTVAQAEREKMDSAARKLQLDIDQLQNHKASLYGDVADLQKDLQGKKEELTRLKTELNEARHHLQRLEQDLKNATKQKEELFCEQAALKDRISEYSKKCEECQEAQSQKEKQLLQLCREIEEQELEQTKQKLLLQDLREKIQQEERKWEDCTAKLQDQKQRLEEELAEQQRLLEQTAMRIQGAEEQIRKLQEEESCYSVLKETISKTRHQVSEQEVKLREKAAEACSLQRELELSKARENMLQHKIQAERKKAEKHIAGLKEAIQTQRAQLERALHEQKQENQCLQEEMASVEQVAQDNHQRAKQLMRNLGQIQEEYLQLQSQMKSQEDLEKRQKEMKGTVKMLKLEVRDKMRTCLKDLSQSPPEANSEAKGRTQSDLESLKENYPFTDKESRMLCFDEKLDLSKVHIMDEQWRGKARREQLQHREDWLKAQLRQCMSKQVEVLIKGKQQTEGTLHSLKRQVDVLDELVSSASTDSPFQSLNSSGFTASLHEESSLAKYKSAGSPSRTAAAISPQPQPVLQYKA
ncbi:centriolin isoform X2 [Varanus komodoensis]|uniref:centriolin isoform X2 n=1 Tax=Varanus komodoensis TaxID=61221 RepID=UPI001CF7BC7D|nr:centriolin isoform X2 [Varanus komodoensis]